MGRERVLFDAPFRKRVCIVIDGTHVTVAGFAYLVGKSVNDVTEACAVLFDHPVIVDHLDKLAFFNVRECGDRLLRHFGWNETDIAAAMKQVRTPRSVTFASSTHAGVPLRKRQREEVHCAEGAMDQPEGLIDEWTSSPFFSRRVQEARRGAHCLRNGGDPKARVRQAARGVGIAVGARARHYERHGRGCVCVHDGAHFRGRIKTHTKKIHNGSFCARVVPCPLCAWQPTHL